MQDVGDRGAGGKGGESPQWETVTSITQPGPAFPGFPVNGKASLLGGPSSSGCTREAGPRAARGPDDLLPRASVQGCAGAVLTVAQKVREGKEPGRPAGTVCRCAVQLDARSGDCYVSLLGEVWVVAGVKTMCLRI